SLFFRQTARFAPSPRPEAFTPPDVEQYGELPTETVARRWVELFMRRGPLTAEQRSRGAQFVHYAFGAGWGGLYGLTRESWRGFGGVPASILSGQVFGQAVWVMGDNVIQHAFRLGGAPTKYPLKTHGYAMLAHAVYGGAVAGTYEMLRPRS